MLRSTTIGNNLLRKLSPPSFIGNYKNTITKRKFGGGGGHGHAHSPSTQQYGGFHEPHVATWHKLAGDGMMTVMFLWIFYRAREDLTFVLGIDHPWDAHHHDHHDDHHGEDDDEWVKEKPGAVPKKGSH